MESDSHSPKEPQSRRETARGHVVLAVGDDQSLREKGTEAGGQ